MYKLVITPDAVLVNRAHEVKKFDKKLLDIISEMSDTLNATTDPVGVGLAAPQVGLPIRLFLTKPQENSPITPFINPVIVETSEAAGIPNHTNSAKIEAKKPAKSKKKLLEGCLSIPNIWGNVTRKKTVTVEYQDETGKKHHKKFTGFPAIIIQHEIDHLDGTLFTKHVIAQGEKLYRSYKNEKGEEEFEEVKI